MSKLVYINSDEATSFNESAFNSNGELNTAKYSNFNLTFREPIIPPPNHKTRIFLNSATIPFSYYNIREGINDRLLGSISFGAVVSRKMTQIASNNSIESIVSFFDTNGISEAIKIPSGNYDSISFGKMLRRLIREKIEYFIWYYINDGTLDITNAIDQQFIGSAMWVCNDLSTHLFTYEENSGAMDIDTSNNLRDSIQTGDIDWIQDDLSGILTIIGANKYPYSLTLMFPSSINGTTTMTDIVCSKELGFAPDGSSAYTTITNYNPYDTDAIQPTHTSFISQYPAYNIATAQKNIYKYQPSLITLYDSLGVVVELPNAQSLTGYSCDTGVSGFEGFNKNYSPLTMDVEGSVEGLFLRCSVVRNGVYTSHTKGGENIIGRIPIDVSKGVNRTSLILSSPSDNSIYEQIITTPIITTISLKLTDQRGRLVDLNGMNAIYGLQFDFIPAKTQDIRRKAETEILKSYIREKIL